MEADEQIGKIVPTVATEGNAAVSDLGPSVSRFKKIGITMHRKKERRLYRRRSYEQLAQ